MTTLDDLEARLQEEIRLTAYPKPSWLTAHESGGEHVYDVVIVGGGQAGLTTAFALKRRAVTNTLVLEAAPQGSEGPWTTYAAMHTLRTPKGLTGPDQGLPSLTPEAWYRARYGDDAWDELTFIPKEQWQEYLVWYRKVTEPTVLNGTTVSAIKPAGDYLEVAHTAGTALARRVVVATGLAGNGEWTVAPIIRDNLPEERYFHTGARLDFTRFEGMRLGVLGGGASAFDYAGSALEAGATSVDLFYRRAQIPRVNPFRWMEFYAYGAHFPDMPDEDKWKFTVQFQRTNQPPPQLTWYRCTKWDTFNWHTSAGWDSVGMDGDDVLVKTAVGEFRFDAVISGTGPSVDLGVRPELAEVAKHAAVWSDRFVAPEGWEDQTLAAYPYLGAGFEFTERVPGEAPWLGKIHDITYGARLSMGLNGNMNSGLGAGGRRLADALTKSLFLEDRAVLFASYQAYDVQELVDTGRPGA